MPDVALIILDSCPLFKTTNLLLLSRFLILTVLRIADEPSIPVYDTCAFVDNFCSFIVDNLPCVMLFSKRFEENPLSKALF
jgi:hypothetical protein